MPNKISKKICLLVFILFLPACLLAAEDEYRSQLVNQTNRADGFKLIKTRMWPETGCLVDTGKEVINPGESTMLTIKKSEQCNQGGIGYEIYHANDTNKAKLFGYLSHRFADGKFSVQISRFCNGDKCIFKGLNPEQG